MKTDDYIEDIELREIMKRGVLEVPNSDFEDKVMQKIQLVNIGQVAIRKNLKASWLFLIISIVLFPTGFAVMFNQLDFSFVPTIGESINSALGILVPGGILLFSVIILLQIDNLLRLTFRTRLT